MTLQHEVGFRFRFRTGFQFPILREYLFNNARAGNVDGVLHFSVPYLAGVALQRERLREGRGYNGPLSVPYLAGVALQPTFVRPCNNYLPPLSAVFKDQYFLSEC